MIHTSRNIVSVASVRRNEYDRRATAIARVGIHTKEAALGRKPGRLFSFPADMDQMPVGMTVPSIAGASSHGWRPQLDASALHSLYQVVPCPSHAVKGVEGAHNYQHCLLGQQCRDASRGGAA